MLVGIYSPLYTLAFISFPVSCDENINISMSESAVRILVLGTLCIKCIVGGEVATDAVYKIGDSKIDRSIGRVVDGMLVVYDSESVFSSAVRVHCMSAAHNASHSALLYLHESACRSHYTKSLFHDIKACVYVNVSLEASSNHWDDHHQ